MTNRPSWLELLLRDAPAEELERHHRAGGSDAEEARRALLLHTRLRDQAQRAAGLTALLQTASRLASSRNLPELLKEIAVQARQLLRTDVCYLALVEAGALRIAYFDGVLGPTAAEMRLSLTAGLAGRIVSTTKPAATTDYLSDTSIEHLPQADRFAAEERLHSILGVPLHADGHVIGVLFAAERSRRPFTEDETALLAGLAGHAAVAIENSRLLELERASAQELRRANEHLRESSAAVDRAIDLHERLTDAVVRGGGPTDVVRALAEVLHAPVQLLDADDRPLAGPDLGVVAPREVLSPEERRAVVTGELVLCPVVATDEFLGCLVLRPHGAVDDAEVRLLERGAVGIALSLVQQRAVTEATLRSRGELLTALVEGGDVEELTRRAGAARVDLSQPHVIALVDAQDAVARRAAGDYGRRCDGLAVARGGRVVLLLPAGSDLRPLAAVATTGASIPVQGAASVPAAFADADRCLRAALALDRRDVVVTSESLGVYRYLLAADGPSGAAEFVTRTIGPLLEHDAARGTELVRTLETYLAKGRQHTAAADALHIHPNTLYQRLARVAAVLGDTWRDEDRSLDLHLALRLHTLAAQL